jgi:hypothetical protein
MPTKSGKWARHRGGGTPRDYGPCGTVLDRNVALLFSHPERDFSYFAPVTPLIEEALLIPFYINGEAVGTIWVIAHDHSRRFDADDLRVMTNLATFAGQLTKRCCPCMQCSGSPRSSSPLMMPS